MLKSKQDYFQVSEKAGLEKRCPIVEHCERRADTLSLFNNWDFAVGRQRVLEEPIVQLIGVGPSKIGGETAYSCSGLCPESCMFDSGYIQGFYEGVPAIEGSYDKYNDPCFELIETGHYSECAEYCKYTRNKTQENKAIKPKPYLIEHHQWLTGTAIALVGLIIAIFAL